MPIAINAALAASNFDGCRTATIFFMPILNSFCFWRTQRWDHRDYFMSRGGGRATRALAVGRAVPLLAFPNLRNAYVMLMENLYRSYRNVALAFPIPPV